MLSIGQQYENIMAALKRIEQGGAEPVRPPENIVESLRAAAADWMETEIGHVYGQTVLDILDGVR